MPAQVTPPAMHSPASVLIVDDELLIRDTLAEFLAQEGFEVVACDDGEKALALRANGVLTLPCATCSFPASMASNCLKDF